MRFLERQCEHCGGKGSYRLPRRGELRRVREQAGITLRAMARHLECSPGYLHDVETGRRAALPWVWNAYPAGLP